MTAAERWKKIHKRLKKLQNEDIKEESELIYTAYDNLLEAYQEAQANPIYIKIKK